MTRDPGARTYLVGYGTLLDVRSLGSSIGHRVAREKAIVPVLVEGYQRVFNLRPDHYVPLTSNKLGAPGVENAAMNVEPVTGARLNGVAIPSTLAEIQTLDERERYYEKVTVPLVEFDTGHELGSGYMYVAPVDSPHVERRPDVLMPLWRDIVWARQGAYAIGDAFGTCFDETTFLADGRRLMIDVYRELLRDTSDVPPPPVRRDPT